MSYKHYSTGFNGITNYLQEKHPDLIKKQKDYFQYASQVSKLIRKYLSEKNIPHKKDGSVKSNMHNANLIQKDFSSFTEYLKQLNQ